MGRTKTEDQSETVSQKYQEYLEAKHAEKKTAKVEQARRTLEELERDYDSALSVVSKVNGARRILKNA